MGAACCVAARDRTIQHGASGEILQRNIRHSASWSFRWDSRVGVAGEDTSIGQISEVAGRNDAPELKSRTDVSAAHVSLEAGSSTQRNQTSTSPKSPLNHERAESTTSSASNQLISGNASVEVKAESSQSSVHAFIKQPPSLHASSSSASPLQPQSNPLSPPPLPSTVVQGPAQKYQLPSEIHNSGRSSPVENQRVPSGMSTASNESTRRSFGRSSEGWSAHAFSDVRSSSQRERCSFDSDTFSFTRDNSSRKNGRDSRSTSVDFSSCGICSKQLAEKSAWSIEKIVGGNELEVVAVLICGHVYHAECLETITSEANKYDPACPVCAFGEKQTLKLTAKMVKAERDFKVKNSKKLKNKEVDIDGSFDFDYWKSSSAEGKVPKLLNSSSLKISSAKPFLKRHFSLGSRSIKSLSENPFHKKKGLFWAKSSRV